MLDDVEVEHALDAVQRLLERRRDGGFDRLCVGAVVHRRHAHLRRGQVRILRHRHRRDGDDAGEDDHQRADRREDRALDEGVDKHEGNYWGWTGAPSPSFWMPETIRRSPALTPLFTT